MMMRSNQLLFAAFVLLWAFGASAQISNSPFTQSLNLNGSGTPPTISSVGSTNYTFAAQAGNANSTIGALSVAVSSGAFGGALALATSGACTGTNNGLFAISGSTLQIGASDITTPATYSICVRATDATFTNSPYYQALTLTGTGAGLVVTTFTFTNDTASTLPAGTPVSFGQGFRYGDIMPGTYPLIVDPANSNAPLAGQQWDEIATFNENGGNGSWRHAVWAAWLPASLAAGATKQLGFLTTTGTYSESSRQPLSALCSGAASHDLKIHLTDVRNQNDTVRDSGNATFDICSNIGNTGRDAPRHVRAGNVYDEYIVSGMPLYTSGHYDPLLYVQCNVDIFTKASDGASAGDVRWVCHMHNSWENVTSGSTGNAGNPGPVGFANDPQAVSYRAEIDDGASDVLDWSNLDATVASTSNPVVNAASNGCNHQGETVCLYVPSSLGANTWYTGQATRVSSTGTPVAGLTNGQLYYVWPSSSATIAPPNTQYVSLGTTPYVDQFPMTSSQGSGTTTFSTRVQHYHFETWQTLDWTGQDNWAPFGTTTRVTRKVYPALTPTEMRYWEQSGLVIPMNLSQPTPNFATIWGDGLGTNYEPFGRLNVIGGGAVGPRPDLGIVNEWSNKAFITQAQADWDNARLFTLGTSMHGYSTLLDESTGRISPLNNGPPTGAGGNGNGGTYAGLGALRNQINWIGVPATVTGIANPDHNDPSTSVADIAGGTMNYGTQLDHMPAFDGFTYMIFGDRHFLDMMQWHGNRDFAQQRVGPGPELGQGYYRDNNAKYTDGNTYHYYGLTTVCFQGSGCAWLTRDVLNAAAFGADNSPERQLFNDMITETGNYWPLFLAYRDGPGSAGYSLSIYPPGEPDTSGAGILNSTQAMTYDASVAYEGAAWLHTPVFNTWNSKLQRYMEGVCGQQLPGTISDFYCTDQMTQPQIANGNGVQTGFGGNVGQYMNGTDASEFGNYSLGSSGMPIKSNGQMEFNGYPPLQSGDTMKFIYNGWSGSADVPIDQLAGSRWFPIINIDNSGSSGWSHTFSLQCNTADHTTWPTQCPTAGGPFTGFTRGGVPLSGVSAPYFPKLRLTFDPGAGVGYVNNNYSQYAGQTINGLAILGYSVPHAQASLANRCTASPGAVCYSSTMPSFWWDSSIVVPGLPLPINTAEWKLTSGSVSGTTVADYSAGDNPATVTNGPLTFGALGANFNGTSQYLDNSTLKPNTSALTVSAWFSPASLSGNPRLVANSQTDVDHKGFQLMFNVGDGPNTGFCDVGNGTAEGKATWSQQISIGAWYHYACVYDGATVKAYINGVQVASTAFAGGAIAAGTGPDINVGRNPAYAGDYFNGAIYDVQIKEQALSANQVLALYNGTTPPAPAAMACDIGPPYTGPIPAAAQQAGFTHCGANYDFTYTGNFTNTIAGTAYTYNWGNMSTWFTCNSGGGAPYLMIYGENTNVGCDQSHQHIATDSGVQTFALTYLQSDAAAGHYIARLETQGNGATATFNMAPEYYIEYVKRQDQTTSCAGNFCGINALSTFTRVGGAPCFIGTDMEWDSGASGTGVGQSWWNISCPGGASYNGTVAPGATSASPVNGAIDTNVQTWGNLTTGDGVSVMASCNYSADGAINGLTASSFHSCFSNTVVPPFAGAGVFSQGQPLYMYMFGGEDNNQVPLSVPSVTTYMQRITVWECPGYKTGACITNPAVTTAPPSGGSSVCNSPAVPHPAQAVGFTTLAYCADFTQQAATNNVINGAAQTMNWTATTGGNLNWMDCNGATNSPRVGPIAGKQWIPFSLGIGPASIPCGAFSVAPDTASGVNALQLTAIPSYGNTLVQMSTGIDSCSTSTNPCYEVFPTTNLYAEISWRLGSTNLSNFTSTGNVVADFWSWYANTTTNAGCLEIDFIEYFNFAPKGPGYAVGCKPTIAGGTASDTYTLDANYHTLGTLVSSNGTNFSTACVYKDGVETMTSNQCTTASGGSSEVYTQQGYLVLMNAADWPTALSSGSYNVDIAWIRIWSCAGWNTTGNPATTSNTCSVASPPTTPP